MNFYNLLKLSQGLAQPQNDAIQGDAVASLISSIHTMFGLGAPNQWDDQGFNKIDHSDPMLQHMSDYPISNSFPIPIKEAVRAVTILSKYKKRQLPNWQDLYNGIQGLIDEKTGSTPTKDLPADKIVYKGKNKWGKFLFYIPNLGRKLTIIQKAIGEATGNTKDAWKLFSAARDLGLDIYGIDRNALGVAVKMLFNYKYDTIDMLPIMSEVIKEEDAKAASQEPQEAKPGEVAKPQQQVQTGKQKIQQVELLYNGTLIITLGNIPNKEAFKAWNDTIQKLKSDYRIGYNKDNHARVFYDPDIDLVDDIMYAIKNYFDVAPLEELKGKLSKAPERKPNANVNEKGVILQVENIMANTKDKWQLAFTYGQKGSRSGEDLKDILKFMFPAFGKNGQRFNSAVPQNAPYDPSDQKDPDNPYKGKDEKAPGMAKCLIRADYNQYRQAGAIFKKYGFDVSMFNKIIAGLISVGAVKQTRIEGDLDGFQKDVGFIDAAGNKRKTKVNDNDKFLKELDGYKKKIIRNGEEVDFELYDLQKNGVAFLYGHKAALLGDSTGTGKTVQTVIAADMRMKNNGGSCLIITLNATQEQWGEEVKRFAKVNPEDISFDPNKLATWIILTYPMFQTPQTREETTSKLQSYVREGKITCFILDECHSVKNSGAARTENMQNISSFTD